MFNPSGQQHRLAHGDQEMVVVEVGGGIRAYSVGGDAVLDGYGADESCSGGRGQVLTPWPNRTGDGRFAWAGRTWQLPLTEPERGNAIHGLVRWASWRPVEVEPDRARLAYRLPPQPGWPWAIDFEVTYRLGDRGLEVATSAEYLGVPANARAGDTPSACPFGLGWHPYLAAFGGSVDDTVLVVPARTVYQADERGLPVGRAPVDGTDEDFRTGRGIGAAELDSAFGDLQRDGDGRAVVELQAGDGTRRTRLWMDRAYTHVMVFTGDTLPEGERRRAVAIEPMTCAPDMLRSGDGRLELEPGRRFEATWGLEAVKFS